MKTRFEYKGKVREEALPIKDSLLLPKRASVCISKCVLLVPGRILPLSQDGGIHGPFTGAQMQAWIDLGYFEGENAVMMRPAKCGAIEQVCGHGVVCLQTDGRPTGLHAVYPCVICVSDTKSTAV